MIADDPGDRDELEAVRDELEAVRQEVAVIGALLAQALFDEAEVFVVDSTRLVMTIGTA